VGSDIRNALYAGPLRGIARHLGVGFLLSQYHHFADARLRREYNRNKPNFVQTSVDGIVVAAHAASLGEYLRIAKLAHERKLLTAMGLILSEGAVVWDVGANLGLYSIWLAKTVGPFGKIFAFEPEHRARTRLVQNVAFNGLKNVEAIAVALGDRTGTVRFYACDDFASGTHSLFDSGPAHRRESVTVEMRRGDELVEIGRAKLPSLIKIDVEGAELEVLAGIARTLRQRILQGVLCEVHSAVLAKRGFADGPRRVQTMLHDAGLTSQRWVDYSHLLAMRN
jgi:FkbM family methyltransferase